MTGPRSPVEPSDLAAETVSVPGGDLRLLRPHEAAELPDDREVEWAPLVPYWSILWRSGVALARELADRPLRGLRVVELGCGLGVPSLVASRGGAVVLATDTSSEALRLLAANAARNEVAVQTAEVDWARPDDLVAHGPFDLVLAADVLYERASVALLTALLPRLAPRVLLADPGRPAAGAFLEAAARRWSVTTTIRGVVRIYELS